MQELCILVPGEKINERIFHTQPTFFFYSCVFFLRFLSVDTLAMPPFPGLRRQNNGSSVSDTAPTSASTPISLSLRHPKHSITLPLNYCGSRHQRQPSMCLMHRRSADQRQVSRIPQTPPPSPTLETLELATIVTNTSPCPPPSFEPSSCS